MPCTHTRQTVTFPGFQRQMNWANGANGAAETLSSGAGQVRHVSILLTLKAHTLGSFKSLERSPVGSAVTTSGESWHGP